MKNVQKDAISNCKIVLLFISILITFESYSQVNSLYINEVLSSNVSSGLSPTYNEYADWIEIYNSGASAVNLAGYSITDDPDDPTRYVIPSGISIAAGSYLVLWADKKNETIHTNFKLDRDGEFVGLYNSTGAVVDSFRLGNQLNDVSYGRETGNTGNFVFFTNTTRGTANNNTFYEGLAPEPVFSISGGFYSGSQSLTITLSGSADIRYTTDGTEPDETSGLFVSPMTIDTTLALRVKTYKTDYLPGNIYTQTYFIDEEVNLPFISIVTDPDNFWSDENGIYVTGTNGTSGTCDGTVRNVNQDWERPVNVEIYDVNGNLGFNQEAGVKIFGGCSRTRFPQKSLALFARSSYGKGSFKYKFFAEKPVEEFETFLLRSTADDARFAFMRDALAQACLTEHMDVDIQANTPVSVFLNGEYFGIHYIREKLNEHYLVGNFGVDKDNVNILIQNASVVYGSNTDYSSMMDYIDGSNMSTEAAYNEIKNRMEVDQYIDYEISHIYLGERDWPGNNIKFWNTNTGNHKKWRWLCYDMDQCFTHTYEDKLAVATDPNCYCGWPNPDWSTKLLRKLLQNQDFENQFVQMYAYHLATTFDSLRLDHYVDSFALRLAPEIPRHITKWGGLVDPDMNEGWGPPEPTFNSVPEWEANVDVIRQFNHQRPAEAIQHIKDKFSLASMSKITISNADINGGKTMFYSKKLPASFSAGLFNNVPVHLSAIPSYGYIFSHWEVNKSGAISTLTTNEIDYTPNGTATLTAVFEEDADGVPQIIFNEINYHSASETDPMDWVEIYNAGSLTVDMSGWKFSDDNNANEFIFENGFNLEPGAYYVICENTTAFDNVHENISNRVGNFDFGLSNSGELIRIMNQDGIVVDSVHYNDNYPWPLGTDATGHTISLISTGLDNDIPANWKASTGFGTPGKANIDDTDTTDTTSIILPINMLVKLENLYPNPVKEFGYINYQTSDDGNLKIQVVDIYGRVVKILADEFKPTGYYTIKVDANDYNDGIYLYKLEFNNRLIDTKRMVIIK